MNDKWIELSYYQFPSFNTSFKRDAYEQCEDIEEETEEDECLDWKNKYMFIR